MTCCRASSSRRRSNTSYLLFSPPSEISFDEWVFNTEAHPIRIVPRLDKVEELGEAEEKPESAALVRPFRRKQGRVSVQN